MNEKNMHGRVFKKLREERGYKLKDVAGDVISTRTLTRFENDETSLPIATFEKLLKNCDLVSLDYLAYYVENTEIETTEFAKRMKSYMESGFSEEIVNEFINISCIGLVEYQLVSFLNLNNHEERIIYNL